MGRAGGGHSGGGHSGGGHHVSSGGHSGGGHHVSSSGGHSGRHSGHGGGFGRGPGGFGPGPGRFGRGPGIGSGCGSGCGCFGFAIIGICFVICLLVSGIEFITGGSVSDWQEDNGYYKEVQVREKLTKDIPYMTDCVVDEIGWINDPEGLGEKLEGFWDETGVQPFIYMKAYDSSLEDDDSKLQWAKDYYDANFTQENIFLYVYFAEEDTDEDVGYMCYVNGYDTDSIMDEDAIDIFWDNVDYYWYNWSADDTDGMFYEIFTATAVDVMYEEVYEEGPGESGETASSDNPVSKLVIIIPVIAVIGAVSYAVYRKKKKQPGSDDYE